MTQAPYRSQASRHGQQAKPGRAKFKNLPYSRIRVAESRPMCKQGRCAERLFHSPQPLVTVESLEPPKRRILPLEGRQRIIWYTQLSSSAGGQRSALICTRARVRRCSAGLGSQAGFFAGTHFVLNWKDEEEKRNSSTAAGLLRFLNKHPQVRPEFLRRGAGLSVWGPVDTKYLGLGALATRITSRAL